MDILQERRSAVNFEEGVEISEEDLKDIFEVTKMGPSAFNIQHAHYVVLRNQKLKDTLKELAFKQHKVSTASAAIVVFGHKKAFEKAPDIYQGLVDLGAMDEDMYNDLMGTIEMLYKDNDKFQTEEAIRNASLSAMQFMLAAKQQGWDTCPMIGFEPDKVAKFCGKSDEYVPVMMITIGKEKKHGPRGYRKPVSEFVDFI